MNDLARYQDVIGQLSRLKTYTHVLLCFPMPEGVSRDSVAKLLETAALKLTSTFPWLASKVINEGSRPGNSGTFKLAPCSLFAAPNTVIRVKDCSRVCVSYVKITQARGPFPLFDGKILGPVKAFPEIYEESESEPAPVLVIQANFIQGGILLDAAAQHNFIDGGGLFQCMRLFAKAIRGEEFSDFETQQGNRDRRSLIPLLGPNEPMLDHSHLRRPPLSEYPSQQQSPTTSRPPAAWYCFRFSAPKLAQLKGLANDDISRGGCDPSIPFVSTNDTLSAFCWKRVGAVRLHRRQRPDDLSKFSRALDARRAMQIPKEYMGQMGYNATCRLSFRELEKASLGTVASILRRTARDVNNEYSVRSWVTFIANEPDKSSIMFGGSFNPDTDIGLSSLAHVELYSAEFGILGKPELVRRPNFHPLESCVYFWSQTEAGDFDVLMCLNEADVQALKMDQEWKEYAEYIG
ncbi:hypothetical protein EPUS_08852 [Endocarpon pusillum Z07020]|uniref:Trichothecene 3-O-acetyltransferase-like N-terminal domain-containing protein n=1 Tax=Endocarpon pusillum (strain Z07020 / HMAS-L-300199) TaxID=1263415 RepID=U1HR81_ENDPU|nr:uncharacterized protein EPUS_08852 [Endocarpon pusillum Z07020]ERF72995.1 hypothetical protein EPUS_08852 [Endocarpon pusillum Z07020]